MIDIDSYYSCPLAYGGTLYLNGEPVTTLDSLDPSCTTIAKYAFLGNTDLTRVVLPESIISVQDGAFEGCSKIRYLEVGSNVTNMEDGVFRGCTSLRTIKFVDSDQTLNLGYYGGWHGYFHDSPLRNVYIGRKIDWDDDGYNYDDYYPFTTVTTAIFNAEEIASDYGFSEDRPGNHKLSTVYIGPKCKEISISSIRLTDMYIFCDDIKRAYWGGNNSIYEISNIYVINKSSVPESIAALKHQSINNLIETQNIQNGASYTYGSLPLITTDNFHNNVTGMTFRTPIHPLYSSVGFYDQGISVTLENELWNVDVNLPFSYSVIPATLTVIANDISKQYGSKIPELSCSFFGFKNDENKDVLTRLPNVETTATANSNVGTYPIIAWGAEAQNYTFNYERGILTITKADQRIEWEQQFNAVNVGNLIELTATSSSGLPVKYSSSDESIAEIISQGNTKFVRFIKPGKVSLRAFQNGNENYNEADLVCKTAIVGCLVSDITFEQNSVTLTEGETIQLTATVTPNYASNKVLTWNSSNSEVATVDANGKVFAIKQGNTTITAKSTDGSDISASISVTVVKLVSSIYINPINLTLGIGDEATIVAYALPSDATNPRLRWYSENENIAKVEKGIVTAIGTGTTYIIVESTDKSDIKEKCEVSVQTMVGVSSSSSDNLTIYAANSTIYIANLPIGQSACIFNADGRMIYKEVSTGNLISVKPTLHGVYIVTVGTKSFKVSL